MSLSESDLAVALIWYKSHVEQTSEVSVSDLARLMHDLSLRGQVNSSRLASNLSKHIDLVRGKVRNTFKLKLSSQASLNSKYEQLLARPLPKVTSHIIDENDFVGTRKYFETMVHQINGCYQFGFYDACILICRRLMESLLIEAFEHKGKADAIKLRGHYFQLAEIIAQARGGQHIKLARGTADILDEIKDVGDTAAHSRTYVTKQKDVDDVKLKFRRMIAELASLAGIGASA